MTNYPSNLSGHYINPLLSQFIIARQYREAAKLSAEEKELGVKIAERKEELVATETELSDENRKLLELNEELEQLRMERMGEERQAGWHGNASLANEL